jgi:serine/threonine-protein kinase
LNKDYEKENSTKWKSLIYKIFSIEIPERAEWLNYDSILSILKLIPNSGADIHAFFTFGGGEDLEAVKKSNEEGCIELSLGGTTNIIRPRKLMFESFSGDDYVSMYFRLASDELKESGIYDNKQNNYEEVTEIEPLHYESRSVWDANEFKGEYLPSDARLVVRILEGDLLLLCKTSPYRVALDKSNGSQLNQGPEEFRRYMELLIKTKNNR